jgi:hypothetical protein
MLKRIEPRFVVNVPRLLEPGVLYVSMEFGTAVHACCCGCGEQVVTPFSPRDWSLTYDGETVSLWPSIGNWNMHCRSHYVIRKNDVLDFRGRSKLERPDEAAAQRAEHKAHRPWWASLFARGNPHSGK